MLLEVRGPGRNGCEARCWVDSSVEALSICFPAHAGEHVVADSGRLVLTDLWSFVFTPVLYSSLCDTAWREHRIRLSCGRGWLDISCRIRAIRSVGRSVFFSSEHEGVF
jgi:hypothetical protein